MSDNSGYIDSVIVDLKDKLDDFVVAFGDELIRRVQDRTPVRTGHLRDSWDYLPFKGGIDIRNTAEYAAYIEYGTPTIAPRGMLRTTLLEAEEIGEIAAIKVGLK